MKKKCFFILFIVCICSLSFAQGSDTFLLRTAKLHDTVKIQELSQRAMYFKEMGDWRLMNQYAIEISNLSIKEKNPKKTAFAYNLRGNYLQSIAQFDKANYYYFRALKLSDSIQNHSGISSSYGYLGGLFNEQGDYLKALSYYRKALEVRKALKNKASISSCLSNIGIEFDNLQLFDSAYYYYSESASIKRELKDTMGLAISYINFGVHFLLRNLPDSSARYYKEAIKIYEKQGDVYSIAWSELGYSKVLTAKRKYKESNALIWKTLAFTIPNMEMSMLSRSYEGLSNNFEKLHQFDSSLFYFKQKTLIADSLLDLDSKQHLIESELSNQYEIKEEKAKAEQMQKDLLNKEEKQKQLIIIYAVSIGGVLLMLLVLFVYRGLKQQRKANAIISEQKIMVEHQKYLVEEKHKEITDSINYAERIQRSFLASDELLEEHLKNYFVFFQPKDVVSGDFYWATSTSLSHPDSNQNLFYLVTADSTGHGVPGAIMSLLNITSIESALKDGNTSPADILNATRKTIIDRLKKDGSAEGGKDGMDCSLLCFDFKNSRFTYSAANNPVWVVRESQLIELVSDKMPVGKHDKDQISFTQYEFHLQKGDTVYTLTDGLPDQFGGPNGKKYKYKQLKELLTSIATLPTEIQREKLRESFVNWKGNLEQVDDVCVIGIRI
ncbi:MAG: SpoIIE family protein phosphatase [Bacteroidetes bacterium]|nr:SpoIIE family protein phosphatase [Bacteroidota bacterium]